MERGLLDIRTGEPFTARDRLHHREETTLAGAASGISPRGRSLVTARNLTMGGRPSPIPSGWVRVEYLRSTGTQYIKTGFIPDNTCGIKILFSANATGRDAVVVGCRRASEQRWWVNQGAYSIYCGWGGYRNVASYAPDRFYDVEHNFFNSRQFSVDGVVRETSIYSYVLPASTRDAFLFAANDAGAAGLFTGSQIASCKFSRGGDVVMDFVAVKNEETNEGAMCDLKTGAIYRNAGTADFITGPRI